MRAQGRRGGYSKSKSRSLSRTPSPALTAFLDKKYESSMPPAALTAAMKLYGKNAPLKKDSRFIQRFTDEKGNIETSRMVQYLNEDEVVERGKGLSEEAVGRVYQTCSNQDNNLSFEYIMKMGEQNGIKITQTMAKGMVRMYGKGKDHLDLDDCLRVNQRHKKQSLERRK